MNSSGRGGRGRALPRPFLSDGGSRCLAVLPEKRLAIGTQGGRKKPEEEPGARSWESL